jgi:hypothetical protein
MSKIDALTANLLYETVAVIHTAFEDVPRTVAMVKVLKTDTLNKKLETAFVKTNSINDAWWNNEGVTKMFPDGACRSTSVGDMVLVGKDKYVCSSSGWKTLEAATACDAAGLSG